MEKKIEKAKKPHPNWGGKREGAGRKTGTGPYKKNPKNTMLPFRVSAITAQRIKQLRELTKQDATSFVDMLEAWVEQVAKDYGLVENKDEYVTMPSDKKMLHIYYRSFGRAYPTLDLSVPEQAYQQNPEFYNSISADIVEMIISDNGLEDRLEEECRRDFRTIAELIYQEFLNTGTEDTYIEKWDESDYDDEKYIQNLPPEEKKEAIQEMEEEVLDKLLRIYHHERTFHDY